MSNNLLPNNFYLESHMRYLFDFEMIVFDEWRTEIVEWCLDHFGPDRFAEINPYEVMVVETGKWSYFLNHIFFKNEVDAILFKLRWSDVFDKD